MNSSKQITPAHGGWLPVRVPLWSALVALWLAASLTTPGMAVSTPFDQVPEADFEIESIRVDGLEHGPEVAVVNQSLLLPGVRYTENQLRQAIFRVRRLPFVYDASMRLERGSERGRHVLVIEVVESHRLFSRFEARYRDFTTANDDPGLSNDYDIPDLAIGVRYFVGANGVLFAGLDDDESGFAAGYTQYNLFGTRARASLTLRRGSCCPSDDADDSFGLRLDEDLVRLGDFKGVSLLVSLPIRGNHSLHFEGSYVEEDDSSVSIGLPRDDIEPPFLDEDFQFVPYRLETSLTVLQASWVLDSRDDVFLPRSGVRAEAGLRHLETDLDIGQPLFTVQGVTLLDPTVVQEIFPSTDQTDLFADVTVHWQLQRGTLSAGGDLRYSESSFRFATEARYAGGEIGYALPLLEGRLKGAGRFRFESRLRHRWIEVEREQTPLAPSFGGDSSDNGFLYAGLAFRNRWTVLRLGARLEYGLDR